MSVRIALPEIPKELIACLINSERYVNSVGLDNKLLELMRYQVSQINGCTYCIDMHHKEAIAAGEEEKRLHAVNYFRSTQYFSKNEMAFLSWSEALTDPAFADDLDTLYQSLREFYNQDQIANMTMAIIQINSWNRLAKGFGFEGGHYVAGQH